MKLRTLPPSPALADVVKVLWIHEGGTPAHALDRVPPAGREEILINLADGELRCCHADGTVKGRTPGPLVCGLHLSPYSIDTR